MSYKSPLSKLPAKRSKTECRKPIILDEIRLPDGRVFNTNQLLAAKSKRESINLRTRRGARDPQTKPTKTPTYTTMTKYSYGERVWIASATPEAIAHRYPDVKPEYITSFIQQSKDIVFRIESQQDLITGPGSSQD